MKKIFIIIILNLFLSNIFGQEKLDSIALKSFRVTSYIKDKKVDANSDILFYIYDGKLISTSDNQSDVLYFIGSPKREKMSFGNVWSIQCKDKGGFFCGLFIGYVSKTDTYYIYITYNNIELFYQCNLSKEKPINPSPDNILTFEDLSNKEFATEPKELSFK
jgi:hypothetical protein